RFFRPGILRRLHSFPTRRSSDLLPFCLAPRLWTVWHNRVHHGNTNRQGRDPDAMATLEEYKENRLARLSSELQYRCRGVFTLLRSEEHTSELQSRENLVCRLLRE